MWPIPQCLQQLRLRGVKLGILFSIRPIAATDQYRRRCVIKARSVSGECSLLRNRTEPSAKAT